MPSSSKASKKAQIFNPTSSHFRSNYWSKDESKFGKKLLEKMGWQEGQGLGLQNQGVTEHIKIRLKLDNKGLGFRIKEDQWLEVRNEFSDLLAQLSQSTENEDQLNIKDKRSLKAASESFKSRVHYHKFTHGKDISRYNKKDLAGILGEKEQTKSMVPDKEEFIQCGNMEEYFRNRRKKVRMNNVPSVDAENGTENLKQEVQESVTIEPLVEKKRKRKHSIEQIGNLDSIENNPTVTEDSMYPVRKKKLKKDLGKQEVEPESGEDTCNSFSTGEIQSSKSQQELITVEQPAKKKKKRKHSDKQNDTSSIEIEDSLPQDIKTKSKKKEKLVNQLRKELPESKFELSESKQLRKKSKNKVTNDDLLIVIGDNEFESPEPLNENLISVEPLVKKKKKRKLLNEPIEISNSIGNSVEDLTIEKIEKKSKKNKKRVDGFTEKTSGNICKKVDDTIVCLSDEEVEVVTDPIPSIIDSKNDSTSVQPLTKKKKKQKHCNEQIEILDTSGDNSPEVVHKNEKDEKCIDESKNEILESESIQIDKARNDSEPLSQEKLSVKKKRKRKRRHSNEQIADSNSIENHPEVLENKSVYPKIEKKSKKTLKSVNEPTKEVLKNEAEAIIDLCNETQIVEKSSSKDSPKIDVKPLSKAERIVQKSRLLKRLQSKEITHAFIGTNLTEIPGYGNVPS